MESWDQKKVKLKQKFAILLDNDLNFIDGHKEDMILKLQIKLHKTKEELSMIIENL